MTNLQLEFPLGVVHQTVYSVLDTIQRLIREKRSFCLNFQDPSSQVVILTTCNGPCKNLFITLRSRSDEMFKNLSKFNIAVATLKVTMDFDIKDGILTLFFEPESEEVKSYIEYLWQIVQ